MHQMLLEQDEWSWGLLCTQKNGRQKQNDDKGSPLLHAKDGVVQAAVGAS